MRGEIQERTREIQERREERTGDTIDRREHWRGETYTKKKEVYGRRCENIPPKGEREWWGE